MKYRFESMKNLPTFSKVFVIPIGNEGFKFSTTRVTSIKVIPNSPPEAFKIFEDMNEKVCKFYLIVEVYPTYENVKKLQDWINFLFENSRMKINYDL